ncbi:MoxR-like ATPase [Stackebrandtia albiflava]|uniref:MoxR-like ATPase n=1 Tax=Stackebrandtia albiflava TaxID=406432 RepID=A0A562UYV1_9ACTN|nr:AAA family ATPase [Stackebrandtia albiflava]TWJ10820.1 MoxR-like ATPase [Stackebrandtia albiflava]
MNRQVEPAEVRYAAELALLAEESGPRPPGWRLTPSAVVTFIMGDGGRISGKFLGDRALVERAVITLAGRRGLLLVGEPGTAKSMLSELLTAAISGDSSRTVQGSAGTHEEQLRYGWNYQLLLAKGPSAEALVPSPILSAMRAGAVARIEEVTRCLPEVQDALVSVLSERHMSVPELGETEYAVDGFNVIATANLRDRGVNEMSAALKRRFNFEVIEPIGSLEAETALVKREAMRTITGGNAPAEVDDAVVEALVTVFRDLRQGRTVEGWPVERTTAVLSTAEAVAVAGSLGLQSAYFSVGDPVSLLPGHLLGVARKDDPADQAKLVGYWDSTIRRRAEGGARLWKRLYELRHVVGE